MFSQFLFSIDHHCEARRAAVSVVRVEGVNCKSEVGEFLCISRNEPTEVLKNMNKNIHQRYIAKADQLHHASKYGGWTDPYENYPTPKPRVKKSYYGS